MEKLLKISGGQLRRELINLENIQLLLSSKHGNQKRYSINKDFMLYDELKNIFLKTISAGDIIRDSLSKLREIELAFIYGSFAKGEEHPGSDLDIMIIGNTPDKEISLVISDVEKKLKRTINYSLYERKEVKIRLKKKTTSFILFSVNPFAQITPGDAFASTLEFMDRMRRKRHRAVYDIAGLTSIKEANEAIDNTESFVNAISEILKP